VHCDTVLARLHSNIRNYAAVASLWQPDLATIHSSYCCYWDYQVGVAAVIPIAAGGSPLRAGGFGGPVEYVMINIVAWVSFLIMVYSLGYMKGDDGLTRYWFFMTSSSATCSS